MLVPTVVEPATPETESCDGNASSSSSDDERRASILRPKKSEHVLFSYGEEPLKGESRNASNHR